VSAVNTLKGGPRARRAAVLCAEPAFRDFIEQKHGLPARTKTQIAQAVRTLCGPEGQPLASRKLIDHDAAARDRFDDLRGNFAKWRQGLE